MRAAGEQGVEAAIAALNRARAAGGDTSLLRRRRGHAARRAVPRAQAVPRGDRPAAGVPRGVPAVRRAPTRCWPRPTWAPATSRPPRPSLREGESVEAMFPWEPPQIERARTAVRKAKAGIRGRDRGAGPGRRRHPGRGEDVPGAAGPAGHAGPSSMRTTSTISATGCCRRGNLEAAVYVFEKSAQLYPDSWNAHDSLGEALAAGGPEGAGDRQLPKVARAESAQQEWPRCAEAVGGREVAGRVHPGDPPDGNDCDLISVSLQCCGPGCPRYSCMNRCAKTLALPIMLSMIV